MKKYLTLIPILLVVIAIIAFFLNKNIEIHKAEKKLSDLKALSYELKDAFDLHTNLIKNPELTVDKKRVSHSIETIDYMIKNYLDTLNNLDYERLYRIAKVINEKQSKLTHIYTTITTDKIVLKNSIASAIKDYQAYMQHKHSLSSSDKRFMNYLFKSALNKSYKRVVRLNSSREANSLNQNLKLIQDKQESLNNSQIKLEENNILKDINQVLLFTFNTSDALNAEISKLVQNLLIVLTLLLLVSLGIYARTIKALAQTIESKRELTEFTHALNNSAIVSKANLQGNITEVNDKFCEISGYEREELIGKSHNIVRHPDMNSKVFEELWDNIKYGVPFQGVIKNLAKDGTAYYVDTTIIPLHNEIGKIDEYLSIRHDVTQFMNNTNS